MKVVELDIIRLVVKNWIFYLQLVGPDGVIYETEMSNRKECEFDFDERVASELSGNVDRFLLAKDINNTGIQSRISAILERRK